ncbi:unnamed protein product [Medioppia subpectinata]|uniref:NADP-dependent oxidoreductase domain-containing protein n=1 Tax=Medioppia subpectinata TaxID=1979941 RepID=A0A7R9KN92_9ACAR|nr:unnamed protein product [Medioppia subpectinata]CAG2105692.1 unnamed protein product [Medioppia subpectinata]
MIRLNNGIEMPALGVGTGGLTSSGGFLSGQALVDTINTAIDIGYRHIDTASNYGNEVAIGRTLNALIANGIVNREDLFVTTKIFWHTFPVTDIMAATVEAVRLSVQQLDLQYVDLMLLHRPRDVVPDYNAQVWRGLEWALSAGLVRAIGVSNFGVPELEGLLSTALVVPAVNQIKSHPKCGNRDVIDWCHKQGIRVTAHTPLGAGSLTTDETIGSIGRTYGKSAAQVMIKWQLQRGLAVIPKTTKTTRICDNFNVFDFSLTEEEMNVLENM